MVYHIYTTAQPFQVMASYDTIQSQLIDGQAIVIKKELVKLSEDKNELTGELIKSEGVHSVIRYSTYP